MHSFLRAVPLFGWLSLAYSAEIIKVTAVGSSIKSCDAALVEDTYSKTEEKNIDWRLAQSIDEGTYNQVKTNLGASVVIFGVPIGASYQDFKENITSFNLLNNNLIQRKIFKTSLGRRSILSQAKTIPIA